MTPSYLPKGRLRNAFRTVGIVLLCLAVLTAIIGWAAFKVALYNGRVECLWIRCVEVINKDR